MGVGSTITVPQYEDENFYDVIEKAVDITHVGDMAAGALGELVPALVEGGIIIPASIAAGILAPFVAVGSGHNAALRNRSRDNFFEGFSVGLVMSANGASRDYIKSRHEWQSPPTESVYPEKRETFRKLHNLGLELGIRQGAKFNTVDQRAFFSYLHSRLLPEDQRRFSPRVPWRDWKEADKKEYYDKLSSMVKQVMLTNDLQLTIH
jgi:hypothetical protein